MCVCAWYMPGECLGLRAELKDWGRMMGARRMTRRQHVCGGERV